MAIFLYGTLRLPPLLACVTGLEEGATLRPARLPDHAVRWARGESFPMLVPEPGAVAEGVLLDPPGGEPLHRIDYYEAAFGYGRSRVSVDTAEGREAAVAYTCPEGTWQPGAPWSLADWAGRWGAISLRAAEEVMERRGIDPPEAIGQTFTQTRVRASSWQRAQSDSAPNGLRFGLTEADVSVEARRRPYRYFFMVEEQDLRFRRFEGGPSDLVTRAAFVMGDAVTLLPYDPVRDRVLLVEQFRFGVHVRGDRNPWSLEPVAGRIDPGETPEDAARREAQEEAGLRVRRLELVGRYYPSPGGVTEYLFSYVGIADLPDDVAGINGVAAEDENIRGVLLSFDALMELLTSGEAETAPLILSIQWLALHRDRLRGA